MKNIFQKNQLMITALAIMIAIAGYLQFAENTTADGLETTAVDSGNVITEKYTAEKVNQQVGTDTSDTILDLSDEDLLSLSENAISGGEEIGYENMDIASLDSDVNVVMEDYLEEGMDQLVAEAPLEERIGATPDEGEIPGEAVFTSAGSLEIMADAKLLKEQTRAKNKETLMGIIGNEFLSDEQKAEAVNSMVEMTRIAEMESAAEILLEAKGFSDVVVSVSGDGADVVVNAAELSEAQRAQIEDIVRRKTGISPENIIISTVVRD